MRIIKKIHRASMMIGAMSILLPIVFWKWIPDQIPMHYDAKGVVDHWADKSSIILLFFAIAMLMGLMALVVYFVKSNMESKYSKKQEKNEYSIIYPMVVLMNLSLQLTFAYIMFCVTCARPLGILFFPIAMVGTFAPLVWWMWKYDQMRKVSKEQKRQYMEVERKEKGTAYRTAVDFWLGAILIGVEGLLFLLFLWPLLTEGTFEWLLLVSFLAISIVLFPLFQIRYVLYSGHMMISMGWYGKVRIRYEDITKIEKTMNPISSAAMSLRRIQIDYTEQEMHRFILISPKHRNEFIEELNKRHNKNGAYQ